MLEQRLQDTELQLIRKKKMDPGEDNFRRSNKRVRQSYSGESSHTSVQTLHIQTLQRDTLLNTKAAERQRVVSVRIKIKTSLVLLLEKTRRRNSGQISSTSLKHYMRHDDK